MTTATTTTTTTPAAAPVITTAEPKSHARRDQLLQIEEEIQKIWEEEKIYERSASNSGQDKYLVTFPYPYMNGKLHLGHAFSMTKAEFAVRYQSLLGKNALFPFGFHCTGMPISACADKLKNEMNDFGVPPTQNFPARPKRGDPDYDEANPPKKYQWEIMQEMGIPDDEIPNFTDPYYWLSYFPPKAITDLKRFGVATDFRRSFITTDANPFYDKFIQWQFLTLRELEKVSFGSRYSIYSRATNQICADHDRASGEGVKPKEYTIVKLLVNRPYPPALERAFEALAHEDRGMVNVYLAAATLRPETMFGQTNCWLAPEGDYGLFRVSATDLFVCTERSATNLAYQGYSYPEPHKVEQVGHSFKGVELFGAAITPPSSTVYKTVYVLPMMTVSTKKTTGVVTSVPSDSPDDYAALTDLKKKEALREKYGIKDEWVMPFEPVPIIDIEGYDPCIAVQLYDKMKIQSQNDADKLAVAKDEAYLKGFNDGVLNGNCSEFAGRKISTIKNDVRDWLIQNGHAIPYAEPENQVISRSGDECVVAILDQWYMKYGEEEWRNLVDQHINGPNFRTFNEATQKELEHTVGWLKEWACSRSYGLGTFLPWDKQVLIESLSDSTIYMAYYTIAHLLQGGCLNGSDVSARPLGITPEQLTPRVFDYIFLGKEYPADEDNVPEESKLRQMRDEFEYWYPVNMRVSGKDLIKNHLTFALYNHAAIWEPNGKHHNHKKNMLPESFYCNGYVMVDGFKMSKSLGNFLSVSQTVEEFSSDATRMALADAGDTHDDANFSRLNANSAILRLTTNMAWIKDVMENGDTLLRKVDAEVPYNIQSADKVFETKLELAVQHTKEFYDRMLFREVMKSACFDLQSARDEYRLIVGGTLMREDLIHRYIEVSTLMMSPITPHICDHIWRNILKREGSIVTHGRFPVADVSKIDMVAIQSAKYLDDTLAEFRQAVKNAQKKKTPNKPNVAIVYYADSYTEWQQQVLELMRDVYEKDGLAGISNNQVMAKNLGQKITNKRVMNNAMSFFAFKQREFIASKEDSAILSGKVPFDEKSIIEGNMQLVLDQGFQGAVKKVKIFAASDPSAPEDKIKANAAPTKPTVALVYDAAEEQ